MIENIFEDYYLNEDFENLFEEIDGLEEFCESEKCFGIELYSVSNNQNSFIEKISINEFKLFSFKTVVLDKEHKETLDEILFSDTLYNNLIFDSSNSSSLLEISKMLLTSSLISFVVDKISRVYSSLSSGVSVLSCKSVA